MATFSLNAHRLEFAHRYSRLIVKVDDTLITSYRLDDEDNSVSIEIIGTDYQVLEAKPIEEQDQPDKYADGCSVHFSDERLNAMGLIDLQVEEGPLSVQYSLSCGPVRLAAQRRSPHPLWIKPFDRQCLQIENN